MSQMVSGPTKEVVLYRDAMDWGGNVATAVRKHAMPRSNLCEQPGFFMCDIFYRDTGNQESGC